ncbi:MAG: UTRA domain-containing protein [Rhodobacteraceae bacterium]|nr:UTRA domain-containing protein [Paracoccaceae bacterium]
MSGNWTEVRDEIKRRVLERELLPGAKLPNDQELAKEFGCARTTVQRAMQDLAQSGTVKRRRKGGTMIALHPITRTTLDIPITRLEIEAAGKAYSYFLVSREILESPLHVASSFGLTRPTEMLHVAALHMADKRPYIYEDRWVAHATTPEILDVDLSRESANEWLVRNRPYSDCEVRFLAKKATHHEAELLATDVDEALFVIERTTWIDTAPITMVRAIAAPGYQLTTKAK